MAHEFILRVHTKISIMSHWSIKTENFFLYFLFWPRIRLEKGKLKYQLFWCKCKFLLVNERKKWRVWIKQMGIFGLDLENTNKIRNFADRSVGLAKHNFHFKKLLKKGGRFFRSQDHWFLKYHTHYYPSVEVWVIAVQCSIKWFFKKNSQENKPPFHFSKFFWNACLAVVEKTEEKGSGGGLPHVILPLACIFLALAPHFRLGTI